MNLVQKSINYVQAISAEIIMKAQSGHTGVALGAASILFTLFKDHYKFDIKNEHINRDRFVLSAGHASALYYTLLYAFGFDVSIEDLENFRKLGSKTPGHPELNCIKGVEVSTGPLGQGVANAVGLAIAQEHYAKLFNVQKFQIFDNKTYCFVGDGCLMEGVAQEAISLAGHLKLKNLILLYDCNKITIDGKLSVSNNEDVIEKFKACGWRVIVCKKGHDYNCITKAIEKAKKSKDKPTIVVFYTKIGYNSVKEDNHKIHGVPLTADEFEKLKEKLGITTSMYIPNSILKFCRQSTLRNQEKIEEWKRNLILYETTHPELYKMLVSYKHEGKLPKEKLYKMFAGVEKISGRDANKKVLNEVASKIPSIIGGSADLFSSTKTYIENGKDITSQDFSGRNIYFGIREHAMSAICNGISLYDNTITFNSTFLVFANYMLAGIRMSALMNLPVWYFFTHDSIYVGEDGPTHQPIEQLGQLRLVPNLTVFRPCDPIELIDCYELALNLRTPCVFALSRQDLPVVAKEGGALFGAYSLVKDENAKIKFLASGSEVDLCLQAKKLLNKDNIPVEIVSFPSVEVFENQKESYKQELLSGAKVIISVEVSNDTYWYKYTKNNFSINTFGESGKGEEVAKQFGFTAKRLAEYAKKLVK